MAQQPASIPCDRIRHSTCPHFRVTRLSADATAVLSSRRIRPQSSGPAGTILLGDQSRPHSACDAVVRDRGNRRLVECRLVARILDSRFRLDSWLDECRGRHHRWQSFPELDDSFHKSRPMVRCNATKRDRPDPDADVQDLRQLRIPWPTQDRPRTGKGLLGFAVGSWRFAVSGSSRPRLVGRGSRKTGEVGAKELSFPALFLERHRYAHRAGPKMIHRR